MTVEILYFDGCPSFEQIVPRVRELARDAGAQVVLRAIETLEAAEAEQFLGSPTFRVDGRDIDPTAASRTDFGLKCRLYRDGDNQSRVPPEAWIRAALEGRDA
jgi:hypothetical protein